MVARWVRPIDRFPSMAMSSLLLLLALLACTLAVVCGTDQLERHAQGIRNQQFEYQHALADAHDKASLANAVHAVPAARSSLRTLSQHVANLLGIDLDDVDDHEVLDSKLSQAFVNAAAPIFLEVLAASKTETKTQLSDGVAANGEATARAKAVASAGVGVATPFDPSSGLSEPTPTCRQLLTDWMAKCAFGPRPT